MNNNIKKFNELKLNYSYKEDEATSKVNLLCGDSPHGVLLLYTNLRHFGSKHSSKTFTNIHHSTICLTTGP